ncbi:Nucleolar protein 6 [Apiospora arundinis]|uniref:U3 small nucleolar RNA-associated protein 22 n=1 Tax=Apiospora arundinis TaxID=335852 RepID=A0ABR2JMJ4_9PEZI
MENNSAKRRKLGSGPFVPVGTSSTPAASAFADATEELLLDVQQDYAKPFEGVDDILRQFKSTIEALEPQEPTLISEATTKFEKANGIRVPYPNPRPTKDSPYKLAFAKPAQVNVVGSYVTRTMIRTQATHAIDMIVVMPADLFQDKDFRDLRYFYKRSFYLARICAGLRKELKESMELNFQYLHGNELLPVLVAQPTKASRKFAIRVIPCAPENLFPASKLWPTTNSVRRNGNESKEALAPTPFYNATLKAESLYQPYLRLLTTTGKTCPGFKDACILGRVWLQQRGFGSDVSQGGFGSFEFAVLVALLLSGGGRKGEPLLAKSLGSSQIIKATIQYLANANFQKKPAVFGTYPTDTDAMRQDGPVLYDATRNLNLLWKMSPWSANLLQQFAKWSLAGLKDNSLDQFDPLFIIKVHDKSQIYDLQANVDLSSSTQSFQSQDCHGRTWNFSEKLYQVLKKALGERATLISIYMPKSDDWSISAVPTVAQSGTVSVGVIYEPTSVFRRMDLGPEAEQKKEAAQYQEFWGEKSELRRFQDGSIRECIEWAKEASANIPKQIIRYITQLHFCLDDSSVSLYGAEANISPADTQYFEAAKESFRTLEHDLRELPDLPLHINQIAGIGPELRYASLRLPTTDKPVRPMEVVISFEASGKWTDNLAANQRLKIAFLLKIGESLEEAKEEIKTHLGLDQAAQDTHNLAFLDVVYEDGFAFRLRVRSDAEEKQLEMQTRNKQLDRHVQTEAAASLAIIRRTYTNLPLHTQTMSSWCTRLPTLSPAIRFTKQWFASQKLASHINEEVIELLVLQAFLKPFPWRTPTSAFTGFLRTMHLISRWDWPEEPLVVDHSDSITADERTAIFARFKECRKQDPRFNRTVLFVADSHDTSGTTYTRDGPSRVVANQMVKLARSVCELVRANGNLKRLLQPSLKHYDVVITLNPKALKSILREHGAAKQSQFKNLLGERSHAAVLPLAEPPVNVLLQQLRAQYATALVFFHGGQDDHVITALWNPELDQRTRKVEMPASFKPMAKNGDTLEVDRTSILAEIARIGGDMIEKIKVKGEA